MIFFKKTLNWNSLFKLSYMLNKQSKRNEWRNEETINFPPSHVTNQKSDQKFGFRGKFYRRIYLFVFKSLYVGTAKFEIFSRLMSINLAQLKKKKIGVNPAEWCPSCKMTFTDWPPIRQMFLYKWNMIPPNCLTL